MFCGKQQEFKWGRISFSIYLTHLRLLSDTVTSSFSSDDTLSFAISSTWRPNKTQTDVWLEQHRFHCYCQWVRGVFDSGLTLCVRKKETSLKARSRNISQSIIFWIVLCTTQMWNWFVCLHSLCPRVSLSLCSAFLWFELSESCEVVCSQEQHSLIIRMNKFSNIADTYEWH